MKKKITAIILMVVLVLALAIPMAVPVAAHTEGSPYTVDLIADGGEPPGIVVGTVSVWNDGTDLYVKYQTTDGWEMTETHLHVAEQLEDIPQTTGGKKGNGAGNPIPGQFSEGDSYAPPVTEAEFTIPLNGWGPGTPLFIAAHAGVQKLSDVIPASFASGASTDSVLVIAEGSPNYPVGYGGSYSGTSVPSMLTWVHPSWPSIAGAQWISSAYEVEDPPPNSWRLFTRSFDLPSNAINISGTLEITSDNAEEVELNGTPVGIDGEVYGPFIDDQEWSTIISYPVIPKAGPNSLGVMVRNYAGRSSPTDNPTGLIYKMDYEYQLLRTETAWGAGDRFVEKGNWATYFTYHIQETEPAILVVTQALSGNNDDNERTTVAGYLTALGYTDVDYLPEPGGGLTSGDLAGYDVVIYLSWSYPAAYTNIGTAQTLIDYFDGGGGLIVVGDDISRVGSQSSPGHPYQPQHSTLGNDWEAMTRLDYINNGGSTERGITDGYLITLGSGHSVLDGIESQTFTYYIDPDTTVFQTTTGATSLATATRNSSTPDPALTGGTAIVAYDDGGGKIVVIGLAFYNGYYNGGGSISVPAIPSTIAQTLIDNSINWVR